MEEDPSHRWTTNALDEYDVLLLETRFRTRKIWKAGESTNINHTGKDDEPVLQIVQHDWRLHENIQIDSIQKEMGFINRTTPK